MPRVWVIWVPASLEMAPPMSVLHELSSKQVMEIRRSRLRFFIGCFLCIGKLHVNTTQERILHVKTTTRSHIRARVRQTTRQDPQFLHHEFWMTMYVSSGENRPSFTKL